MTEAWVQEMCRRWARAKLRIWNGGDGKGHEDGWPASSIAGRIRDEGEGLGQGAIRQHYAEVMVGEALLVERVVKGMPFKQRLVLHLHYIIHPGSAKEKAKSAEVSVASYWSILNNAHARIEGFIDALEWKESIARIPPEKVGAR